MNYAVALLGRLPRRATVWPGILPAQVSQRSACLEPRRASVKLIRITAPLTSSTSLPQLSQTSLVTRATDFLLHRRFSRLSLPKRKRNLGGVTSLLNSPRAKQAQKGLFL